MEKENIVISNENRFVAEAEALAKIKQILSGLSNRSAVTVLREAASGYQMLVVSNSASSGPRNIAASSSLGKRIPAGRGRGSKNPMNSDPNVARLRDLVRQSNETLRALRVRQGQLDDSSEEVVQHKALLAELSSAKASFRGQRPTEGSSSSSPKGKEEKKVQETL